MDTLDVADTKTKTTRRSTFINVTSCSFYLFLSFTRRHACPSTSAIHRAHKSITFNRVCVFRMRKRSGAASRQTSRRRWWWPMTLRWRLSRSCVLSGDSCRRSKIATPNFLQTSRPCRESGTISISFLFFPVAPTQLASLTVDLFYHGEMFSRVSPCPKIMYSQSFYPQEASMISHQNMKKCV